MALVKVKPTSAGPPLAGQGRQPEPAQGRAGRVAGRVAEARLGPQQQRPHHDPPQGRRPQAALPRSSTSGATRTASRRRSSASNTTRTAARNIALLLLRRRRAPLHHRAARRRGRHGAHVGHRSAASSRATACRCATSRSARRSTASRCSRARARRSRARPARRCSCSRAKASTRSFACARARSARCTSTAAPSIGEVGNEEHNLRSIGKAGAQRWRGIRPTVRGIAMNPVDHPMGGRTNGGGGVTTRCRRGARRPRATRRARTSGPTRMIVRRRHATKG